MDKVTRWQGKKSAYVGPVPSRTRMSWMQPGDRDVVRNEQIEGKG